MKRIISILMLSLALLGGIAGAQNVSIQLTPQGMPIQIPASGGSFDYTISITNNGTTPLRASVWCMITLPSGNPYGPVLGPANITLSPSQMMERQRSQVIPAGAPAGNYAFNGYVGVYPDTVWDSDSFPFEKALEGSELWVARYNGPGNESDQAHSIAVDDSDNVYVTGGSDGGRSDEYATIKYNSEGIRQWVARYDGPGNESDEASSIAVDGDGNVYVTGYSFGDTTEEDYATIKYNSEGVQQWVTRYNGPANGVDYAYCLAVDGGGNVYVTGNSFGHTTAADYATVKYNSQGVEQWVARYSNLPNGDDYAYSVAVDGNGNVYVTGGSQGSGTQDDYTTIKYDSAGIEQWVARYNGPGNASDWPHSLAIDGNANIYVTGRSAGSGTDWDYATVKYNSQGVEQWVTRYNGPTNDFDYAYSLAVDGGGNVYVTGSSYSRGINYATIKYNSEGAQQWVALYNCPWNSGVEVPSLAVDGGGNVYMTGSSIESPAGYDYITIKYDSAGVQIWVALYNGPWNSQDQPSSIAVDGVGNVLVTGASVGIGSNDDYATIKYSGGNIANWLPVEAIVLGQPLPQECRLEGNYPNPFNASTALSYKLQAPSHVSLQIYDTVGRLVETLVDGWRSAGKHELTFDASDLPSAIYFAKLTAGDFTQTQKMVLLK